MADESKEPEVVTPEVLPAPAAPILPGEAEEDEALVTEAVDHINEVYTRKGLETALDIGQYLLETFFDSNAANFRDKGKDHESFRKLAESDALVMSASWLWNAVSVTEQYQLLPPEIAQALPFSHHKALLPVHDEKAKLRLAKKAADKGLSKRALEDEVKKVRQKEQTGARRGRPPLPAFVKGIGTIRKGVQLAQSEAVTMEAFATYSPAKAKDLLGGLQGEIEALTVLTGQVQTAIDAWEAKMKDMAEKAGVPKTE